MKIWVDKNGDIWEAVVATLKNGMVGVGDTAIEAIEDLLQQLKTLKPEEYID